ncbi:hypothetical protein Hdeb2414_s0027g00694641 [Helianthus debilis subsp. tardiflorus]
MEGIESKALAENVEGVFRSILQPTNLCYEGVFVWKFLMLQDLKMISLVE